MRMYTDSVRCFGILFQIVTAEQSYIFIQTVSKYWPVVQFVPRKFIDFVVFIFSTKNIPNVFFPIKNLINP